MTSSKAPEAGLDIAFSAERWEHTEREWTRFWNGEQKRPMVITQLIDTRTPAVAGHHRFFPQYPLSMSAEEVIAIESANFSRYRWVGDAFPYRMMEFGPGSLSAYMGAALNVSEDTVWFEPTAKSLAEITTHIDTSSTWYRRIHAILDAALNAWGGRVQIVHSDVGGGLDIFSAIRGNENLLMDFYDDPVRVKEIAAGITAAWMKNYDDEAKKIRSYCRGTANWASMFSKGTTYMLQCDFSYMISPAMFEEFVLPELHALCPHLTDPFYHLDGKGQLPHLDAVLSIPSLKGVQWIPGAGQPDASVWLDVLAKIRKAGKFCQIYTHPEGARRVKRELGGKGFIFSIGGTTEKESQTLFEELIS
ncbi:MAG: hypothetical protein AABZ39_13660 [Spirochaetota bacterium]